MKRIVYALCISLLLSAAVTAYSDGIQEDLQKNLVRLHIIANSDSDADQSVKLKVRNAVLESMDERLKNESRNEIIGNLDEAEKIANDVLRENGFKYTARAVYGKFDFPKKQYKNMTLPAGEYYGVRIILGEGAGHNWWCVMYPPLCVADGAPALDERSDKILRDSLKDETYDVITGTDKEIEVKFKAVELIGELRQKMKEKK